MDYPVSANRSLDYYEWNVGLCNVSSKQKGQKTFA